MTAWQRAEDCYQRSTVTIFDNGGGLGPSTGSGRWAVVADGKWLANIDTLAAAKKFGDTYRELFSDCQDGPEIAEFARHIETQGKEAGFSKAEVVCATATAKAYR